MKTLAIIQARVGSSRLPGKVLLNLGGKTVIEQVVERVKNSKLIDEIVVATSIEKNNLPLIKICAERNISVFVGSENDVLDRFYQVSKLMGAENIVRITADCPLHDAEIIDNVVKTHFKKKTDYTSNVEPPTFPDGLDIECFTFKALNESWTNASLPSEREHVTIYIRNNPDFSKSNYLNQIDLSSKRWTLDEQKDYEFISLVYSKLSKNYTYFGIKEVLKLIEENPEIENINRQYKRNEGLLNSLKEDKLSK